MYMSSKEIEETYSRDGYAFPLDVMSVAEAESVRARLEKAEAEHGSMHYVVKPYLLMSWVLDIAKRKEILDPVRSILGNDLLLWDSEFIIKEPGDEKIVEWHQDLEYFGLSSDDLVTAWLALSPVTKESGCMSFVMGSHKNGLQPHHDTYNPNSVLARGQQLTVDVPLDRAVDVVLAPGQMSLHHGATYHSSGKNTSSDRRIGLCFLYIKPSVKQIHSAWDSATLISGVDTFNHFECEKIPSHDFSKQAIEYQKMVDEKRKSLWQEAEVTWKTRGR